MGTKKQIEMPFYESAEDASYSSILKSKKSPKEIAHQLWPALNLDSAYARLMGSLKHSRPEKLTADEHILIANITGEFDFLYYCAQGCHHSRPEPVSHEDEFEQLQRVYVEAVDHMEGLVRRMERLSAEAPRKIASVKNK